MIKSSINNQGIGMTSDRTRDRLIMRLKEQGIKSNAVLDRIRDVPRHLFVDEALATRSYEDTALPIGLGQTISQPYIVAKMTESLLNSVIGDRILETGTGCGYQTAVLSPFFKENDTRFTALISPFGDENLTSRLLTSSINSEIN